MARDDRSLSGEEIYWWHMLVHGIAFCVAATIGVVLLYPLYSRFEAQTDTAGEALGAFLTCCVIAGGLGPMVTVSLFWLYGLGVRARKLRRLLASFRDFRSSFGKTKIGKRLEPFRLLAPRGSNRPALISEDCHDISH